MSIPELEDMLHGLMLAALIVLVILPLFVIAWIWGALTKD
jgi:hypothetical protein